MTETRTIADVQAEISLGLASGLGCAQIAAAYPGVHRAVIWRIHHQGYEPKNNRVRRALGLSELLTVEVVRNGEGRFTKRTQPRA